ncbi:hypothetical protein Droror1_Dr00012803 [Drosera rotundifolia]
MAFHRAAAHRRRCVPVFSLPNAISMLGTPSCSALVSSHARRAEKPRRRRCERGGKRRNGTLWWRRWLMENRMVKAADGEGESGGGGRLGPIEALTSPSPALTVHETPLSNGFHRAAAHRRRCVPVFSLPNAISMLGTPSCSALGSSHARRTEKLRRRRCERGGKRRNGTLWWQRWLMENRMAKAADGEGESGGGGRLACICIFGFHIPKDQFVLLRSGSVCIFLPLSLPRLDLPPSRRFHRRPHPRRPTPPLSPSSPPPVPFSSPFHHSHRCDFTPPPPLRAISKPLRSQDCRTVNPLSTSLLSSPPPSRSPFPIAAAGHDLLLSPPSLASVAAAGDWVSRRMNGQGRVWEIWKVKGVQMKRSKNARKMKAISKNEKLFEKASKYEMKKIRVKSAKTLYD